MWGHNTTDCLPQLGRKTQENFQFCSNYISLVYSITLATPWENRDREDLDDTFLLLLQSGTGSLLTLGLLSPDFLYTFIIRPSRAVCECEVHRTQLEIGGFSTKGCQ